MEENNKELLSCLKLMHWRGASLSNKVKVVQILNGFSKAIDLTKEEWERYLNKKITVNSLPQQCSIEEDKVWLASEGNFFITMLDQHYPSALLELNDPPLGLYVKGEIDTLQSPQVAIVGSRNQTPLGQKIASDFSRSLCNIGLTITSGLAKGIDASAHY